MSLIKKDNANTDMLRGILAVVVVSGMIFVAIMLVTMTLYKIEGVSNIDKNSSYSGIIDSIASNFSSITGIVTVALFVLVAVGVIIGSLLGLIQF